MHLENRSVSIYSTSLAKKDAGCDGGKQERERERSVRDPVGRLKVPLKHHLNRLVSTWILQYEAENGV